MVFIYTGSSKWFYPRGSGKCTKYEDIANHSSIGLTPIVFAFQIPLPKEFQELNFSPWQQNLKGIVGIETNVEYLSRINLLIHARLGYRNKGSLTLSKIDRLNIRTGI